MIFSVVLTFHIAQLAMLALPVSASCDYDNCLRALKASVFSTRNGAADCASYFKATVTPSANLVSRTTTAIVTATYSTPSKKKRDIVARQETVNPSSIPAYASACSGSAHYSSACSCIGATHTTTTVPTPTKTTTVTSTVTQCADLLPTFILQITDSGVKYEGKDLDGTYGNYDNGDGPLVGFNGGPASDAVILSLAKAGNLIIDSLPFIGNTNGPKGYPKLIHFDSPTPVDFVPVICSIVTGTLNCTNDGYDPNGNNGYQKGVNILQICPSAAVTNDLWIGAEVGKDCYRATFKVRSVCVSHR